MIELVHKHGAKKWSMIAGHLPGRIGKQCRERWHNHLNPEISKRLPPAHTYFLTRSFRTRESVWISLVSRVGLPHHCPCSDDPERESRGAGFSKHILFSRRSPWTEEEDRAAPARTPIPLKIK